MSKKLSQVLEESGIPLDYQAGGTPPRDTTDREVKREPTPRAEKLRDLYINRVKLSADGSICTVFFHSNRGLEAFEELRPELVLYKPSMRSALAKSIHSRRIPDLRFVYDEQFDKQRRVDDLIESLKQEGKL